MIYFAFITFGKMLPEVMVPFVTSPKANFHESPLKVIFLDSTLDPFPPFCASSYKNSPSFFQPSTLPTLPSKPPLPPCERSPSPRPVSPSSHRASLASLPFPRSLSSSAPAATSLRRFPSARPSHIPGIPATYGRHSSPLAPLAERPSAGAAHRWR